MPTSPARAASLASTRASARKETAIKKPSGPKASRPPVTRVTMDLETTLLEAFEAAFQVPYQPRNRLIEQAMRLMLDLDKARRDPQEFLRPARSRAGNH